MEDLYSHEPPSPLPVGLGSSSNIAILIVVAVGSLILGALVWGGIGFAVASKFHLGLILFPFAVGGIGGLCMCYGGGFGRWAGMIAVATAIIDSVIGDALWVFWYNKKSLAKLFGNELGSMLNTVLNLTKVALYALVAYSACTITVFNRVH